MASSKVRLRVRGECAPADNTPHRRGLRPIIADRKGRDLPSAGMWVPSNPSLETADPSRLKSGPSEGFLGSKKGGISDPSLFGLVSIGC